MSISITDFKGAFKAGVRPNLYKVQIARLGPAFEFLCKGASLPASTIGAIDVPYQGRQLKIAGNRTFEPWTLTIMNDTDFFVRRALEEWMSDINSHDNNTGGNTVGEYYSDALVTQLDRNGDPLRTVKMVDIWPSDLSAIELGFDSNDQIEEFTVTLTYNYWESVL